MSPEPCRGGEEEEGKKEEEQWSLFRVDWTDCDFGGSWLVSADVSLTATAEMVLPQHKSPVLRDAVTMCERASASVVSCLRQLN